MEATNTLQVTGTADGTAVTLQAPPARLDQHPAAVYLAGKASAVSRAGLRRSLNRAAAMLTAGVVADALMVDWAQLRYQHVAALRAALIEQGAAPATINHVLTAVRGTLREAWRLGKIDAETLSRAVDVPNVKAEQLPAGRHVDRGEVAALFGACGGADPASARDAALLALLYGSGLRRSEAVALQLADYNQATGAVTVRMGKGRKDRIVYMANGSADALAAWIARRGPWAGALLAPVDKAGQVQQRRLTAQAVLMRLRTLAKRAGWRHSRLTICVAHSWASCLTLGPTSAVCSSLPGTRTSAPRSAMTGAPNTPSAGPPSYCTCRTGRRPCDGAVLVGQSRSSRHISSRAGEGAAS